MAKNVVEVTVKGIDDATRVFDKITNNADQAFSEIETAIKSVPDLDIDAEVDSSKAESNLAGIESAVGEAESAIKSIPDPQIDGGKAESELEGIADQAEETQKSIEGIDFSAIAGGLAAGGGIAGIIEKSLDVSSLDTKIDISFNVPPESMQTVKQATKTVTSYGVDAEASLEGVRRQWALNADASDASNQKVVEGAGAISAAYSGIDFTELIQEVNEIGSELNITDQEALGLTNSLLKVGFPPEQLDIIAEYGKQLTDAGYSAEEVQAIMMAGVETGTWNIDNLLDGLKEGRILLAEFGQGVDDSTADLLKGTSISEKQLQSWGQAVSQGGDKGQQAMVEVAKALNGIDDETTKNALGVKFFGTMYEDQGQNIIDTLLNAENATVNLKEGQDAVNETVKKLDASPAVQMEQAMNDITAAVAPLFVKIAGVIGKVAEWVSANPQLAATLTVIATIIGIVTGAFMALAPILTTISIGFGAISAPILIIIGIIGALIAIFILLWQNADSVGQFLVNSWNWIKEMASIIFTAIGEFFKMIWNGIKQAAILVWNVLVTFFTTIWNTIKTVAMTIFNAIATFFTTIWNGIKAVAVAVWNGITSFFTTIWNGIKTAAIAIWNGIKAFFTNVWNGIKITAMTVFNALKTFFSTTWNGIKTVISTVWNWIKGFLQKLWNGIKATATTVFNALKNFFSTIWNAIKQVTSTVWNGIKSFISGLWNRIKSTASSVFNGIKSVISSIWNTVKRITSSVWNGIKSVISGIINGIKSTVSRVFNGIKSAITNVWNGIKRTTQSIWNGIVKVVKAPINTIIGFINGMINALNSISIKIPKVPDWVPGIGGAGGGTIGFNIPNVPSLATGGIVEKPTLAVVGDAGAGNPEIVAPQNMIRTIIAEELTRILGRLVDGNSNHQKQPLQIILRLGNRDFEVFVDDITKLQKRKKYRLKRV